MAVSSAIRNNTASDILIPSLGFRVSALSTIDTTRMFPLFELRHADDLTAFIAAGDLTVVQNGVDLGLQQWQDFQQGAQPGLGHLWIDGDRSVDMTVSGVVSLNAVSGTVTLSGLGLVEVDPIDDVINISTPDAASLFELVVVSGVLNDALVTATGIILDLVTDISSPASTVQGGFVALDEALSTTTSTSFQEKLSLSGDLSAVFSGTSSQPFRLQWYYEWGYSSASSEIETQITVDDFDVVGTIQWSPSSTNATDFAASSGYIDMTLSSGTHFFDIDFRSTANGKTSRIQRTRMALSPLTLGLNEDDPPQHGV